MVPPGFEPGTLTTWKWCDNQLHHETSQRRGRKEGQHVIKKEGRSAQEEREKKSTEIHCGVVGNIQASHVCAPGSIPGDGVFFKKTEASKEQ